MGVMAVTGAAAQGWQQPTDGEEKAVDPISDGEAKAAVPMAAAAAAAP